MMFFYQMLHLESFMEKSQRCWGLPTCLMFRRWMKLNSASERHSMDWNMARIQGSWSIFPAVAGVCETTLAAQDNRSGFKTLFSSSIQDRHTAIFAEKRWMPFLEETAAILCPSFLLWNWARGLSLSFISPQDLGTLGVWISLGAFLSSRVWTLFHVAVIQISRLRLIETTRQGTFVVGEICKNEIIVDIQTVHFSLMELTFIKRYHQSSWRWISKK